MKLKDAWDHYYFQTGSASTLTRQLALAAMGIIFTFRLEAGDRRVLDQLDPAALWIVLALILDLAQYVIAGERLHRWIRGVERNWPSAPPGDRTPLTLESEIGEVPKRLNPIIVLLWRAKLALVVVGYWYIITYLFERVL